MPRRFFRLFLALLIPLALVATGCGNDDAGTTAQVSEPTTTEAPATAESAPTPTPTPTPTQAPIQRPQRIVSLSPTATEILFAIGAGEQVIAVDEYSYFPPAAPVTDLSGWDPNVEAVLAYEPDLVVISNDANDLVASMEAVGVAVLINPAPADFEGGYEAVADMGMTVGRIDEAAELIARLRTEITSALSSAPVAPVRVYHELGESLHSASSATFIGAVYEAMGTTNIADLADNSGSGYPQLTEEYIVEADPELIVITDQVNYTAEDVAARPGWGEIAAVRNGNIVTVNADIASRWGPRLPQFINAVADALQTVAVPVS